MRVSPLSLPAQSVFRYDLQEDLLNDLAKLRKMACDDGDVVFVLQGHDSVWAHSPLFYVASGNLLPTHFGTVIGKATNDRGKEVTVISVPEEKRPFVEKFLQKSYTIDSLEMLWKAMGSDDVRLRNKDEYLEASTKDMKCILPESMLPDFEIILGGIEGEEHNGSPNFSIKVHRFLLDARIEYYQIKTRAGLKFKDPTPNSSKLSRAIFTEFSLWSIAMHVYCGIPSAIFGIDAKLQDYLTEPEAVDKTLRCNELHKEGLLPDEGIETLLLQISMAANFFLVAQLEDWAHFQIYRLAHHFQCTGNGCAEVIPYVLQAVSDSEVTDEWMINTGISWFSQLCHIPSLWKKSLLSKPSVVFLLIERIKSSIVKDEDEEEDREEENRFIRGEKALELYLRLWKLRQYILLTESVGKWDKDLINPLMEHAIDVISEDLGSSMAFTIERLKGLKKSKGFSKSASEDLIRRILDKTSSMSLEDREGYYWSNIEILKEIIKKREPFVKELRPDQNPDFLDEFPFPEYQLSSLEGGCGVVGGNGTGLELISVSDVGKCEKSVAKTESRLKASAQPFVPRGMLAALMDQSKASENARPNENVVPQDVKTTGQTREELELKEKLLSSAFKPSPFEAAILRARRQNSNRNRLFTLPSSPNQGLPEEQEGKENRKIESLFIGGPSIAGPSISEAIPFYQQTKLANR